MKAKFHLHVYKASFIASCILESCQTCYGDGKKSKSQQKKKEVSKSANAARGNNLYQIQFDWLIDQIFLSFDEWVHDQP